MNQKDFNKLTKKYKDYYSSLTEEQEEDQEKFYTENIKNIYSKTKIKLFDELELFLEKSTITEDNVPTIPYNVFEQFLKKYEQEMIENSENEFTGKRKSNLRKMQTYKELYTEKYIDKIKKTSVGFRLLDDKKIANKASKNTIEYIERYILFFKKKKILQHPSHISIYQVYRLGSIPFHATCVFKFKNFYYEFSHFSGGGNIGSIAFEPYRKTEEKDIYEYEGGNILAKLICEEKIPQEIADDITLQTLLNISMYWWSKTDACNIRTFPGSCTGLVETAVVLTKLNSVCNVGVNNEKSTKKRSPPKSKSTEKQSPHKKKKLSFSFTRKNSVNKKSKKELRDKNFKSKKSPKRRSPRKSPKRRSPKRRSPKRRSPRKSPKRRSPRKSPKRRSPRKSPKRRSPRN